MMPDTISCKNNGATYDSSWIAHHGMTKADHLAKNTLYAGQGYKETSVYTCGTRMAAIWRKP
jgi:Bacterial tandem repeat domain 1